MDTFSDRLAEMLELRHMTQADLAKAVGVGTGTVSYWIKGGAKKPAKYLPAICAALRVTELWLVHGVGEPEGDGIERVEQEVPVSEITNDGFTRHVRMLDYQNLERDGDYQGYMLVDSEILQVGSVIIVDRRKTGSGLYLCCNGKEVFLSQRKDKITRASWHHITDQKVNLNNLEILGYVCGLINNREW
ncbi:helix-turn-helix domain-containing protein [Dongshaea marina]|uniref:helix-turn-helix domain-containing protein n=1 Tax=Dongshaea marina TaxID=2047966 RepID=UPI000D3E38E0|nr:helix-turn-helix transcriptional regulator [Dongshaea marina]